MSFQNLLNDAKLVKGLILLAIVLGVYTPVFSQWTDDFSDSEFTSNPEWVGIIDNFVVEGEVLRLSAPAVSGSSYLATSSNISLEAEWDFFIKLDFNPSSSNYIKVYLIADSANLGNAQNGYFVKIGGTTDEVSLYKISDGSESRIIDGLDDRVDLGSVEISLNVKRSTNGDWELSTKLISETEFVTEVIGNDLEIQESQFFGILCQYTSTRSTKFYIDDISLSGNPYVDPDPPILTAVSTPSNKQIKLSFNEGLDSLEALNLSHYILNDSISPSAVTVIDTDSVLLNFDTELALINNLNISLLPDVAGNKLDTLAKVFFIDPAPYSYRDLVINELFPDPNPQEDLPAFEFVELFNNSTRIIDLEGWQFTDGSKIAIFESQLVFPDSFLIICPEEGIIAYQAYGNTIGLSNWPSLNNGGDSLTLTDKSGVIIDSLTYSIEWYKDEIKDNGGWSLEQINPNPILFDENNWSASVENGGGTPGKINSIFDLGLDVEAPLLISISTPTTNQIKLVVNEALDTLDARVFNHFILNNSEAPSAIYPLSADTILVEFSNSLELINSLEIVGLPDIAGNKLDTLVEVYFIDPLPNLYRDVVINELFVDPNPQEDLPLFEYIELFNNSDKIINLNGWQFTDASKTFTFSNQLIYPDSFLIICPEEALSEYQSFGEAVGASNWPSLNNNGDFLQLVDHTGALIDSLSYTLGWYNNTNKDNGGWSIEQINPNSDCHGICNWAASVDPKGGTPGRVNSVFDLGLDEESPFLIKASTPSINRIRLVFNEEMDSLAVSNPAQYLLNQTIIPSKITLISKDSVQLEFDSNIELENKLELMSLTDLVGNRLDTLVQVVYINPAPYSYRDMVINEIFADPNPQEDLPLFEFVELLNISDRIIDLSNWQFTDGSKNASFPSHLLFPDSILIICSEEAKESYKQLGTTVALSNWPALNNSSDAIKLLDKSEQIIDSLTYTNDWYKNSDKDEGGWSLEQINPLSKCLGAHNWIASNEKQGGTPGKTNSVFAINADFESPQITQALVTDSIVELWFSEPVFPNSYLSTILEADESAIFNISSPSIYSSALISSNLESANLYTIEIPLEDCVGNIGTASSTLIPITSPNSGDIVINEILFDPYSGGYDFVEILNTTDNYYNLSGYLIANKANSNLISDTTLLLKPNNYMAFSEGILFLKNQYLAPDSSLIETDLPTMPNDEGVVLLKSNFGETIDSVFYSNEYHFSLISDVEGISLERISPQGNSNNKDNWRSAAETTGYATPGYENSQSRAPVAKGSISVSPEVITPNNDGQDDYSQISYSLDNSSHTITISVYNLNGQLVKTIANNAIIPPSGFFTWDGTNQHGGILPTAHYIIVSSVISSDGRAITLKNKVVVANEF